MRGFEVFESENGKDALSVLDSKDINLIIADVMMPVLDGNELARLSKERNAELPVLMLTAPDTIEDKRKSFGGGADDYLVKPVDFDELELRIRALLRRYGKISAQKIRMGNVVLDYLEKALTVNGQTIETTKKEFLLLYTLLSSPGKIYSRTQLLDEVWGTDSESLERTVDVHINKLREKLTSSDIRIVAVRGLGYKAEKV